MSSKQNITLAEVVQTYGTSAPAGSSQINSSSVPLVSTERVHCSGDAYVYGSFRTLVQATKGITAPDGTVIAPSIAFAADPSTGMWRSGTGQIGFSSVGVQSLIVSTSALETSAPITTPGGQNLVLEPSGPNIDCTGHNLINVGSIPTNPNYYQVIAPSVLTTTTATPAAIYNVSTMSNYGYTLRTDIVAVDDTDSTSTASIFITGAAKNIGGTVTVSANVTYGTSIDADLAGVSVSHVVSGTTIAVTATGLASTTIKWFGATTVCQTAF
jgi:hypothetical protein